MLKKNEIPPEKRILVTIIYSHKKHTLYFSYTFEECSVFQLFLTQTTAFADCI